VRKYRLPIVLLLVLAAALLVLAFADELASLSAIGSVYEEYEYERGWAYSWAQDGTILVPVYPH